MNNQSIRVGLLGYGFSGRTFHAPVITTVPNLELTKVVQRSGISSKERYPWVEVVNHVEDLYQDEKIDLIVVTTPSTDHFTFIKDALLAGKHVVVEKPFTPTTREADELIALAKKQNKILSVFHNRRWDGDFLTIQQLIQQNLLGDIIHFECRWDSFSPVANPNNWRGSGELGSGVFYDLGVHFLDQILCLFGMPNTVRADIRIVRPDAKAIDYFDVTLDYKTGLSVCLKSSPFVREREPRYTIHGTKGSFIKYGTDPQEEALKKGRDPSYPNWGKESKEWWGKVNTSLNGLHVRGCIETLPGSYPSYYKNIYDSIKGYDELIVKPEEARNAIRIIELAMQSQQEQKTVEVS